MLGVGHINTHTKGPILLLSVVLKLSWGPLFRLTMFHFKTALFRNPLVIQADSLSFTQLIEEIANDSKA